MPSREFCQDVFWCCCRTHRREQQRVRGAGRRGFRSEVVVGCLKNRFCIYTRTRAAVCCTLRILSTARAGRPNRVHRHRRHTGALYNAADTRLAALPSCGHLLGSAPFTSGQVAEAVSWLHRQAHELLTLAARVRLRCGHCRDPTQSPHVPIFDGLPPLTGGLIRHSFVDRLLVQADAPLHRL